jgi:hypothetical protein
MAMPRSIWDESGFMLPKTCRNFIVNSEPSFIPLIKTTNGSNSFHPDLGAYPLS